MRDLNFTVSAGGATPMQCEGRFLWLKEADGPLVVQFFNNEGKNLGLRTMQKGEFINLLEPVTRFEAQNNGASTVTATMVVGEGTSGHTDVQITAAISGDVGVTSGATLGGSGDVSVGLAATVNLATADATRKEVILNCISGAVRVGSAPSASNGHPMSAGDSLVLTTSDLVKAYGVSASTVSVVVVKK